MAAIESVFPESCWIIMSEIDSTTLLREKLLLDKLQYFRFFYQTGSVLIIHLSFPSAAHVPAITLTHHNVEAADNWYL